MEEFGPETTSQENDELTPQGDSSDQVGLTLETEKALSERQEQQSEQELVDYILESAKRIKNADLLTKARESEHQGRVLWGTIKTVIPKALWKPRDVGYEEAVIEVETDDGLIVHVNQRQASYYMSSVDNLIFMIGETVPVVVQNYILIEGTKKNWDEVNYKPNAEYVLLGSIKQAEWSLGKEFERLYNRESSPLKKELRGIVTAIYEPYGAQGYRFLKVSYNGVTITIPGDAFSYVSRSYVQRLEDIVKVGQEVYFKVFALEEQPVTAQMRERHGIMGENETYWSIVGEALYDKEEPHAAISRLKQSGALATQAYLVSETMDGYFVELVDAPGIVLRMRVFSRSNGPTREMFERHDKVVVRLSSLMETYHVTEEGRTQYDGYVSFLPKR